MDAHTRAAHRGSRRLRRVGRVAETAQAAASEGVHGNLGIGHTRWATHGGVTEPNAHPHVSGGLVALVHNGIIENHEEKRAELKKLGYAFGSQTDTEVIAHLVHHHYKASGDLFAAVRAATAELVGAYAIAVIAKDRPGDRALEHSLTYALIEIGDPKATKDGLLSVDPRVRRRDHGPGDDDLEGGIFAVGIARGVVFVRLFEMGVSDKAVVGEHDEGTMGRKFAKTGG